MFRRYIVLITVLIFCFVLCFSGCERDTSFRKDKSDNSSVVEATREPEETEDSKEKPTKKPSVKQTKEPVATPALENVPTQPLSFSSDSYNTFTKLLSSEDYSFSYSKYYGLEESLSLYSKTTVKKSDKSSLLDSKGMLDKNKLIKSIEKNNEKEMSGGKNAINCFYKEISSADKKEICNYIVEIINNTCTASERKEIANSLESMKLFQHTGTPSNAYVSNQLVFVYNPTMSKMYASSQKISTGESEEKMLASVIVHEVMHLKQHQSNDLSDKNGIEIGMCRNYNVSNEKKLVPVDSLWYPWLLDAAAELSATDYLEMEPHTYHKKISYAKSYNFSRLNLLDSKDTLIENVAFSTTLEDVFADLSLKSEAEQKAFLEFMFSVEIIQSEPEDFWENYTKLTGKTPSEDEKLSIRLEIRSQIVKYLSLNFYTNLANALKAGTISDTETLFYLMDMWERDILKHLEYTNDEYLNEAMDYIKWHDKIQTALFSEIAKTSGMKAQDLADMYHNYSLRASANALSEFNAFAKEYLSDLRQNYTSGKFIKNRDMLG